MFAGALTLVNSSNPEGARLPSRSHEFHCRLRTRPSHSTA